jgi:hypothetical protein
MKGKKKALALLFLVVAVIGLVFLSSGLSNIQPSSEWQLYDWESGGRERTMVGTRNNLLTRLPVIPPFVLAILIITTTVAVPVALLLALFSAEIRRAIINELKWMIRFAILIITFLYLFRRLQLNLNRAPAPANLETVPGTPDWITQPSALAAFLIGVTLLTLVVSVGWFLWQRNRFDPLDQIAREAQSTADELRRGADFKSTIIACYFEMCRVLQQKQQIERGRGMTPREFAHRLEELGMAGAQVRRLTHLFEVVRYGGRIPGEVEEEEAIACLTAVAEMAERAAPDRERGLGRIDIFPVRRVR